MWEQKRFVLSWEKPTECCFLEECDKGFRNQYKDKLKAFQKQLCKVSLDSDLRGKLLRGG